jgi:hypothetical protein
MLSVNDCSNLGPSSRILLRAALASTSIISRVSGVAVGDAYEAALRSALLPISYVWPSADLATLYQFGVSSGEGFTASCLRSNLGISPNAAGTLVDVTEAEGFAEGFEGETSEGSFFLRLRLRQS